MDRTKSRLARIVSAFTILGIALAAYGLRYIRAQQSEDYSSRRLLPRLPRHVAVPTVRAAGAPLRRPSGA